jgi:glycosyltransferase involved in cell wall biosynthesis
MAPTARQIESLCQLGIEIDILELKGQRKLKYVKVLPEFLRKARHADLVHAHFGYCGWLARMQWWRPVVVSFMGDDLLGTPDKDGHIIPLSRVVVKINRWLARHVNVVIVKSPEMAEVLHPVQAHVVPNGVDLTLFKPIPRSEALATLGWDAGRDYVLFPGNPEDPRKGYDLAFGAVEQAGKRSERPLKMVALRHVPSDQVPLYMNACSVMLMTSYVEGSPNVVKEAMACNLPIVAVSVGDVPDMLDDVTCSVVCERDPEQIGEALLRMIGGQSNGREVLKKRQLDLLSVGQHIIRLYKLAMEG